MQTLNSQKTTSVISNRTEESQSTKTKSTISSSSHSFQRSKSENTPLFHDSNSGRLVKLDNFSFDSAPNHFHVQSEDIIIRDKQENEEINQELYTTGDFNQGIFSNSLYASKLNDKQFSKYNFLRIIFFRKIGFLIIFTLRIQPLRSEAYKGMMLVFTCWRPPMKWEKKVKKSL